MKRQFNLLSPPAIHSPLGAHRGRIGYRSRWGFGRAVWSRCCWRVRRWVLECERSGLSLHPTGKWCWRRGADSPGFWSLVWSSSSWPAASGKDFQSSTQRCDVVFMTNSPWGSWWRPSLRSSHWRPRTPHCTSLCPAFAPADSRRYSCCHSDMINSSAVFLCSLLTPIRWGEIRNPNNLSASETN